MFSVLLLFVDLLGFFAVFCESVEFFFFAVCDFFLLFSRCVCEFVGFL